MSAVKIVGIVLIAAGILGLAYGRLQLHQGDPRGQDRLARAVGEGQGDGQRPDLGWRRGDRGWRGPAAGAHQELVGSESTDPRGGIRDRQSDLLILRGRKIVIRSGIWLDTGPKRALPASGVRRREACPRRQPRRQQGSAPKR